MNDSPDNARVEAPPLAYATPESDSEKLKSQHQALVVIVFLLALCAVGVFLIG